MSQKIFKFDTYKQAVKTYGSVKKYREVMSRIEEARKEASSYVGQVSKSRKSERAKAYQDANDPRYLDFLFDGDFDWSDYR